MHSRDQIIEKLEQMSFRMRKRVIDMALGAGASSSHLGGGLSLVDITATLYGAIMKFDPQNPNWPERDRFILSKGHGVLGYYTALCEAGLIPESELATFEKNESRLLGHPVIHRDMGIEFSNGSLGMGLSLGIGVALAGRRRQKDYRVFVLMGDGECNEGSVWEAALAATQFKLDHITVIIDRNQFQQTGANQAIMSMGELATKWESFGWDVHSVNGHQVGELYDAFTKEKCVGKPRAIMAHTVKGKGFSFMENNNDWHHSVLTQAQYDMALSELMKTAGASK